MGKSDNVKTRKQLAMEYDELYSDISDDMYQRLCDELGEDFNEELIQQALDRVKYIKENMTYSRIDILFKECPTQAHRPRVNYMTRAMRTPNARDNSKAIEKLVKNVRDELRVICVPMKIILNAYHPMPKDAKPLDKLLYETKHQFGFNKPDFDNVEKAYCDMIQNHIIMDDDIVCSAEYNKFFSFKPRVELSIIFPDYFDAEYTYNKIRKRKKFTELKDEGRIEANLLLPLPKKSRKTKKGMKL